jgi:uncharacterized membrane protein
MATIPTIVISGVAIKGDLIFLSDLHAASIVSSARFEFRNQTNMSGFYLAFALTVTGMLLYHLSQKAVPKDANPFFVIVIAYVVGIALCLLIALASPAKKGLVETFRGSNWAVFTLGAAAALIELGFLLAYRTGWRISIAAVATNAAAAVVLIPVGLLVFKDHLSIRNVIGLILCIVGLALVVR